MSERKTVLLRMRPELYEALRRWAEAEFRSVNGQIEYVLHKAVRAAGRPLAEAEEGEPNDEDSAGPTRE